jgi:tRNA A37 threonylcarbamoyltransferase TsaD
MKAIDHEDQLNQTTAIGPDETLVPLPEPTPSDEPSITSSFSGNHTTRGKKSARKRKRQDKTRLADGLQQNVRRIAGKRHTQAAKDVKTNLETEDLPTASTGFVGRAEKDWEQQGEHVTLQDLFPENEESEFRLVEYQPK